MKWPEHDLNMNSEWYEVPKEKSVVYYRKLLFRKVHILTVHHEHVAKIGQNWTSGKSCTETPNDPLNCPWVKMCIRSIVALWNRFWMNFRFVPWKSLLSLRNNRLTGCSINIPAWGTSDTARNRYKLSKVTVIMELLGWLITNHTENSRIP